MRKSHISRSSLRGFSLIEVTLALGLLAFCVVALLGLLPTGLQAQAQAQDQARAAAALNQVATAVRATKLDGSSYTLPAYFSSSSGSSITFSVGQNNAERHVFAMLDDGTIKQSSAPGTVRQSLYFELQPPAAETAAIRVYAALAWPAKPIDSDTTTLDQLKGRQGFLDTVIYFTPTAD